MANAIPVLGVVLGYWSGLSAIVLYILETFIIGIFHFLKILSLVFFFKGAFDGSRFFGVFGAFFFLVHFNAFVIIQTIFVFAFAEAKHIDGVRSAFHFVENFAPYFHYPFLFSLYGFIINQIALATKEFSLQTKEIATDIGQYMFLPYGRIFLQQILVIVGAFILFSTNSITFVVVLLGVLKAAADLLPIYFGDRWFQGNKGPQSSNKQDIKK